MIHNSIKTLLLILFLTPLNLTQAQELSVTKTDIILDTDGTTIIPGSITFNFDENVFPNHTYHLTSVSNPLGLSCATQYSNDLFFTDEFTIFGIGASLGEPCEGKYCFDVTKDLNSGNPCIIQVCVYINYCRYQQWKGDKWVLTCNAISTGGSSSFTTIDDKTGTSTKDPTELRNEISNTNTKETTDFELVNIYPIPFQQEIQVQLKSASNKSITVKLLDLYGRTLLEENHDMDKGMRIFTLTTKESLPDGLYLVQITNQNGIQKSKQLTHFNQ